MNYIGIDFGTTNTAVVNIVVEEAGSKKSMLLGEEGNRPFSSIVAIPKEGGQPLFGRRVRDERETLAETHDVFLSMKSYLGLSDKKIGTYSPVQIASAFLNYIKDYVKNQYKIEIESASFSFPVDFTAQARHDLLLAAKQANIEVKSFVTESTACYISARKQVKAYSNVMIVDWGGGTLDISILDIRGSKVNEIAVYGEKVGGDDIDLAIAKFIHSKIVREKEGQVSFDDMPHGAKDNIIAKAEHAKIAFSSDTDDYENALTDYGAYGTVEFLLSYDEFKEIVNPIIKEKVVKTIIFALEKADMNKTTIEAVIVAGGSSKLRPFITIMDEVFQDKIVEPENADWIAAIGSATMDMIGGECVLSDNIDVLLSDGTALTLFEGGKDTTDSGEVAVSFALTQDAVSANFIFQNKAGKQYKTVQVRTKGFFNEQLDLTASIGRDQIARVKITNPKIGIDYAEVGEFNKLTFYYDLSEAE